MEIYVRVRYGQVLMKTFLLTDRHLSSGYVLTWPYLSVCMWRKERERLSHLSSSYKATRPVGLGSHPMNFISFQFSCSVMSDSLWSHEPKHTRPPCPLPTPRIYYNSCPLSWWFQPTISFSVIPFSVCPQSFPASGSFQMSQLFALGS